MASPRWVFGHERSWLKSLSRGLRFDDDEFQIARWNPRRLTQPFGVEFAT